MDGPSIWKTNQRFNAAGECALRPWNLERLPGLCCIGSAEYSVVVGRVDPAGLIWIRCQAARNRPLAIGQALHC